VLGVFSVALLTFVGVPLEGEAAPLGLLSFKMAGTPHRALAILLEWDSKAALGHAKIYLVVDSVFAVILGFFIATVAVRLGKRLDEDKWSSRVAWLAFLVAGLNVLENAVLMFEVLRIDSPPPYPQLVLALGAVKLALLGVCVLYLAVGSAKVLRRR
jgi:hypothetical protein